MNPPRAARLGLIAWVFLAACLYALSILLAGTDMMHLAAANPARVWDAQHLLPQAYFASFWFSGDALLRHVAALPPSPWVLHTLHVPLFVAVPFHLQWLYPPVMGLLAMLYACLPLAVSFWVWRGLYVLIGAVVLRRAGLGWGAILLGLMGPAALIDVAEGENGVLTGGLCAASLLLIDRAPRAAGFIVALLSIKPQTAATLPFALLQRRSSPALWAALAGLLVLVAATLPFLGIQGWLWFLLWSPHASSQLVNTPFKQLFPEAGATVFYMMRSFGAPSATALAVQGLSTLVAACALWRLWSVPGRPALPRMAATLALNVLLVPYGYLYDLVGFSIGMAAMCLSTSPVRKPIYAALWLFAGHSATVAGLTGHIFMPVAAALAAFMAWQEAEAPQTPPHARNPA